MITRIWHGRTSSEHADHYLQFLLNDGTREYLQTKGNRSVKVWRSLESEACHFWTVTEWDNIESVKGFAGKDYELAVYYPEDEGILLEKEERVIHCETFFVKAGN